MRVFWLFPTFVALSCGTEVPLDARDNPSTPSRRPAFGAANVPAGGPALTTCTDSVEHNYAFDGPHFNPGTPTTTFVDPDSTVDPSQCGDLEFDDRVRSFTTIYGSQNADESPYKYWWQRGRRANTGVTDSLKWAFPLISVPEDMLDTVQLSMRLSQQWDAVAALLILEDDSTLQLSEVPFLDATSPTWVGLNLAVQHWRQVPVPTLNSVSVNGNNDVVINWDNNHAGRFVDSTAVYRDGGLPLKIVGPSDTMWTDTAVGTGLHTYTVKHLSAPAARLADRALANPNSASPTGTSVTVPGACARLAESNGSTSTWKTTDQYLSAGCSELPANGEFRWFKTGDVALTGWIPDTLLDFAGHSSLSTQYVILKMRNGADSITSVDTVPFTVRDSSVYLTGATFIPEKTTYAYYAYVNGPPTAHSGQWFERYDDGPQWFPATAYYQISMTRIWPYGEYTVDLRQHAAAGGFIHRDQLLIEVCNVQGCQGNAPAQPGAGGQAESPEAGWGLFGAGPWITWGGGGVTKQALRLYDLWGMHDRDSPFASASWIAAAGGQLVDAATGWEVRWSARDPALPDARAFDISVTGAGMRPYTFGMAVDPDVGATGADDVAAYDAERGLVIVSDGDGASGFLLLRGQDNAMASAREYGVGRWAPTTADYAWAAQRGGTQLVGTPRDVLLVLSATETVADRTWQFIVIRGATPAGVRATADAVLGALK